MQTFNDQIPADTATRYAVIFLPPCLAAFLLRSAPLRMGIALATIVVAGAFVRFDNRVPIHLERSFFGVHRVLATARERVLLSGTTNHGAQSVNPSLACEPLSYYSRQGCCRQVFAALRSTGRPRRCRRARWPHCRLREARSALDLLRHQSCRRTPGARETSAIRRVRPTRRSSSATRGCSSRISLTVPFDVLVLDAFSSDSIPVHLMTKGSAVASGTLSPNGLLLVHVSNRFLDLGPVVGAVARSLATRRSRSSTRRRTRNSGSAAISAARWVLVARSSSDREAMMSSGKGVAR